MAETRQTVREAIEHMKETFIRVAWKRVTGEDLRDRGVAQTRSTNQHAPLATMNRGLRPGAGKGAVENRESAPVTQEQRDGCRSGRTGPTANRVDAEQRPEGSNPSPSVPSEVSRFVAGLVASQMGETEDEKKGQNLD